MTARTLHQCEATGQLVEGGPLVRCERPGHLWTAPSGNSFWTCSMHVEVFTLVVAEAGDDPPGFDGTSAP